MDFYADRYPILRKFDEEIRRKVSMFFVYPDGQTAVVATNDDKVYVLSSRADVCNKLGIAVVDFVHQIERLSNKKVIDITGAYTTKLHRGHTYQRNASYSIKDVSLYVQTHAQLYGWSSGRKLNYSWYNTLFTPPHEKSITSICGNEENGIVLVDGDRMKQISSHSCTIAVDLSEVLSPIKQTALGLVNGLARTSDGDVYNLLIHNQSEAELIKELADKHVVNIACGKDHNLAVTEEGELFGWGNNKFGQLGTGTKSDDRINDPIKIEIPTKFGVAEVAAHYRLNVSVARTYENDVFIWGKIGRLEILYPMKTFCYTIDEAVVKFAEFPGTFKAIKNAAIFVQERAINESVTASFDNVVSSDFTFVVENKNIYVQKELLKMRSEHFRMMFSSNWKENSHNKTEITQFSYEVYRGFLNYLYTGKVEVSTSSIFELFDLANSYHEEGLKETCASIMDKNVNERNVIKMYKQGLTYDNETIKEACVRFTTRNFGKVMASEDFLQLDSETKEVFLKHASGRIDHAISRSRPK